MSPSKQRRKEKRQKMREPILPYQPLSEEGKECYKKIYKASGEKWLVDKPTKPTDLKDLGNTIR